MTVIDSTLTKHHLSLTSRIFQAYHYSSTDNTDALDKAISYIAVSEHNSLAHFLESRGHIASLVKLGIPEPLKLNLCLKQNHLKEAVDALEVACHMFNYGRKSEEEKGKSPESSKLTIDALLQCGSKLAAALLRNNHEEFLIRAYTALASQDTHYWQRLALFYVDTARYDELLALKSKMNQMGLTEQEKFVACFLGGSDFADTLVDSDSFPEAIQYYRYQDASMLPQLYKKWNAKLAADNETLGLFILSNTNVFQPPSLASKLSFTSE